MLERAFGDNPLKHNIFMTMKIIKLLSIIILSAVLIGFLWYELYSQPIGGRREVQFSISRGESLKSISGRLVAAGVIKSKFIFEQYAKWNDMASRLQAGDYKLNTDQTIGEIATSLLAAKRDSRRVLIREGETNEEIAKIFAAAGLFSAADFFQAAGANQDLKKRYDFLQDLPVGKSLEGYLFPDTYDFFVGATADEAVKKMLDNFSLKVTPEIIEKIKARGKTLNEVITLASIIEKEVRQPEEMKIVSGIFWSRLSRGQALQSDATLSYALKDKSPAHSAAELEIDTPYNTYKYPGLPPTPIANPGLNALQAAIEPTATDYNFFLTSTDGTVYYAKTFAEHINNKEKYLK